MFGLFVTVFMKNLLKKIGSDSKNYLFIIIIIILFPGNKEAAYCLKKCVKQQENKLYKNLKMQPLFKKIY